MHGLPLEGLLMLALMPLVVAMVLDAHNRSDDLVHAVISEAPHMTQDTAMPHVLEAIAAETHEVPAELLLSIAYSESRYDPRATSYVFGGKRKAHVPTWAWALNPPKGVSGPYFCGTTQVAAKMSWKRCLEMRDLKVSYQTSVQTLSEWIKICRKSKNRIRCALFGYGGGFPAIERGTSTYPTRVLNRARRILNKTLLARERRLQKQAIGAI